MRLPSVLCLARSVAPAGLLMVGRGAVMRGRGAAYQTLIESTARMLVLRCACADGLVGGSLAVCVARRRRCR